MGEGCRALVAPVLTLSVGAQVLGQVALPPKGLAAVVAQVGALACVSVPVDLQLARGRRHVAALVTAQQPTTWRGAVLHPTVTWEGRKWSHDYSAGKASNWGEWLE